AEINPATPSTRASPASPQTALQAPLNTARRASTARCFMGLVPSPRIPGMKRSPQAGLPKSRHLQPAEGAAAGGELVRLDAQALEHGDEQVRQRVVLLLVEGEVLAVAEAAAREQDGEVVVGVRVGAAHAGAVQHHRPVQQRLVALAGAV